jgi:hypothetical protein
VHKGRCLCGEIAFAVDAAPNDVINCHRTFCQKATDSAHLVETLFDKSRFKLLQGSPQVYDHVSEGSGKTIHIHFCARRGTKTHMLFDRFPDSVGVFSGTFDETDWFDRTPGNAVHIFLSTAPKGTVLPAGFEIHDAHYWQSESVASTPRIFAAHTMVTDDLKAQSRKRI